MKKQFFIGALLLWILPAVGSCNDQESSRRPLFNSLKTVGDIVVGVTKLTSVRNEFGGAIRNNEGADGRFNSLCLLSTYQGKKISINLISGALGGWETITEYEVSTIKEGSNETACGSYSLDSSKKLLIFRKSDEITKLFGKPKKLGASSAEYTAMYIKDKSGDGYVIYTGLTVFYGADRTVEKYDYFETESN